jgi:hypothetical protein
MEILHYSSVHLNEALIYSGHFVNYYYLSER